ncbi:DUF4279 domain-containing protein [Rhizobium sp. C1]|uniref:DUF4279 domain-containing protein n=1 Tax=Rhizobium sp. C1 TaxID=1349799 RepID=UPI001E5C1ADA|nr:DUF4279 domain-containing protein [Rhizobium sp. C1]MCD2180045.1 DUF4279 domain-containing protein [Rhizobium sp. C1]
MADVYKTTVSLRFKGDDLDPDELTVALGKKPEIGARRGGVWISPKGGETVSRMGSWILSIKDAEPADIDGQAAALFSDLCQDFTIWRRYAERYQGNIFVGVFLSQFNEGLSISTTTLNAIGLRGLELGFDIYADDGRDDHDSSREE